MIVKWNGRTVCKKVWRAPYAALLDGTKTFELRTDEDRLEVGDRLCLHQWNEDANAPVGQWRCVMRRIVTYALRERFGLPKGLVILGLQARRRWSRP